MIGRSWMAQPMPWPNCRPKADISSGKPKSGAFGHTLHTLSVDTPGLISAMALSSHSRAFLPSAPPLGGRPPRLDQRGGVGEPLARLLVGIVLHRRGAPDVEGPVVA